MHDIDGAIADQHMAALAGHAVADRALARGDLRQRVADWKRQFFPAGWARYDLAKPGTFRLVPPDFRLAELEKDYRAMRVMFLADPPSFERIVETVRGLENRIWKKFRVISQHLILLKNPN